MTRLEPSAQDTCTLGSEGGKEPRGSQPTRQKYLLSLAQPTESMNPSSPFKWRHFQSEIILLGVRWYLRYPLSYRNLEEMMLERGLTVDHTTVYRWVLSLCPRTGQAMQTTLAPNQ